MDLMIEFFTALSMVIGIVIGEALATMAFGRPKKKELFIVELVIFVLALVLMTQTLMLTELDLVTMMGINAIAGLIAAVISRGLSTVLGFAAALPASRPFQKYTREETLAIRSIELLYKHGADEREIKQALYDAGFSKKSVDSIFRTHKFEKRLNPLLRRITELEEELRKK